MCVRLPSSFVELVDGVRVRIGSARRWTYWNGSSDAPDRQIGGC